MSGAHAEPAVLRVRDLAVSFAGGAGPAIKAVDGVSLTLYPRQTVAVVGESGSGKSVTALSVLRLLPTPPARYERGTVELAGVGGGAGVDLLKAPEPHMRSVRGGQIAMIFQEPMTSLNPVFTVGDQVREAVMLHRGVGRREAWEIAGAAMEEVGIRDARARMKDYPHQFSGGMRQRVMIAMALACRPRVLIADEPTTALDVTIQAQILELLRGLKDQRGMAVLLITHDLGIVAGHADVVCVMYAGRVVEYARTEDLFASPMHPYTRGLLECVPRLGARRERLVTVREVVEDPAQFARLRGAERGVRAWWPRHEPPAGVLMAEGPAGDSVLREIGPGHWVRLWRTPAALEGGVRPPDLDARRAPEPASV